MGAPPKFSDLVKGGSGEWYEQPNVKDGGDAFKPQAWVEPQDSLAKGEKAGDVILEKREYNRFRRERRPARDHESPWTSGPTGERREVEDKGMCWTECRMRNAKTVTRAFDVLEYYEYWRINANVQRYYDFMDTWAGDAVGAGGTVAGGIATASASAAAGAGLKAAGGALGGAAVGAPLFGIGVFALTTKYYAKWFDDVSELVSQGWEKVSDEVEGVVEESFAWERCSEVRLCDEGGMVGVDVGEPADPWTPQLPGPPTGPLGGAPVPSPDAGRRPPVVVWVAMVMLAILGLIGWLLFGGSGDGSDARERPKSATTLAGAGASTSVAAAPAGRPPAVGALAATFDQATFTTTYTIDATDPDGDTLSYAWALDPQEDCGVFTGFQSTATWTHPHESQRGQPSLSSFPGDRYCKDTAQQQGGHPAVVRVVVDDGSFRCSAAYEAGSEPGRVEAPLVGPCSTE